MPSMIQKRDKLLDEVTTTLNSHRSGIQSDKHFPDLDRTNMSRKARLERMGDSTDTIWYCYVFPIDVQAVSEQTDSTADKVRQDFEVGVYYEWSQSDSYSGSTQETWDQMMFATGSPIGLWEHLVSLSVVSTANGERTVIKPPQSVRQGADIFGITEMDSQGKEWAHEAQMRVPMVDFVPR